MWLPNVPPKPTTIISSWIAAFIGIAAVVALDSYARVRSDLPFVMGSFGATSVLIYGAINGPLSLSRATCSWAPWCLCSSGCCVGSMSSRGG